jgi:hypothetical protein
VVPHKYIPADIDTILKVIVLSSRSLGGWWYLAVVALLNHAVQLHFISVPLRRERGGGLKGGGGRKRGGGLKGESYTGRCKCQRVSVKRDLMCRK